MVGDQNDMLARLKSVLPPRWFADNTPILDTVLGAIASVWAWTYCNLGYIQKQTRIATATDGWLDMIASDFFGNRLRRRASQSDDRLRRRIQSEVFRERGTRNALLSAMVELTGQSPIIFEPANTGDTGGYGEGRLSSPFSPSGLVYGYAGGWGSLALPFQAFMTVFRPRDTGIATLNGWNDAGGGYGIGIMAYGDRSSIQDLVRDEDITSTIAGVIPASTIVWTRIQSA